MPDAESITYNSSTVGRKISKPLDYLQGLTQSFDWLETLSNPKIHYTSHDFPLFLTCAFPNIIKLKLAIWSYYSWELKSFRSASILDLEDKEFDGVNELCKKIVNQYSRVPSVEYLPSSLFENTLYQIRYLWEIQGFLYKEHCKLLVNDLESMLAYMEDIAISGSKNPAPVVFYRSDMLNQSLNFLVEWDVGARVYTMIDSPNNIFTESPRMVTHMKDYFRKIIQSSELLTQSNAKERRMYFNQLFQKVRELKNLLDS
ncbi:MAG: hypothetical protein IPL56_10010 [Saprospiraceae bacterium]|nr:hypothetical protein [Saprospiraceae bacterium]MBK8512557.1 hypothetical protein [Saprospiraceae bacterium]